VADIELPQPLLRETVTADSEPRMIRKFTSDQKKVDRALKTRGLGGLDDPNILKQLAFLVRDHAHFRKMLIVLEPRKRYECYTALSPYLRFKAKPLDDYIIEAKELAGREHQKAAYEATPELDLIAQDAIRKAQAAEEGKGLLKLTCRTCDRSEGFTGKTADEAYAAARLDGWRKISQGINGVEAQEYFLCLRCSLASTA
jgi:cytochrome c5